MASADYFLKIDGIDGESADSKHRGEIEIESWSWGATNPGSRQGGGGAGKVSMQDFHFVTRLGAQSAVLLQSCASGQHIKQAVLTARKAGGQQMDFLKVTMQDVLISSYQVGGGGDVPMDQVSLSFSKIDMKVTPTRADGQIS